MPLAEKVPPLMTLSFIATSAQPFGSPGRGLGWERGLTFFKPFTLTALKGVLEDAALRRAPSDALAGDTPACVGRRAFVSEPDTSGAH
jgi:hypothetical protein